MNNSPWKKILFATIATLLVLGIRLVLLGNISGDQSPYLFFLFSAVISAWYGGFIGGTAATLLGALAADYYYIPPLHSFALAFTGDYLMLLMFLSAGIFVSLLFERLHQSQKESAYMASILKSSDDAIIAKNLDGGITAWNEGAERIFGYKASEVIGKPITIIIPPDRTQEEQDILARLRKGKRIDHFETVRRAKDGHLIDISLTVSPVHDKTGHIIGAAKVARDITEQKRVREELSEQQEWYRVTLSSIGDAVIATDMRANVKFLNAEAEKMTGWTLQEALDQPLRKIFTIVNEESRQFVENPVDKVIEHGKIVGLANHTMLISKNGTEYPIADTAAPIRSRQDALLGVVLAFHDVADHRKMEKELHKKAAMLIEKDRRKDEFIAMLSHELRNPLAPVSNAFHILKSPSIDKDVKEKAIDMGNRQISHMVRLLDDLLDVSRITHGKIAMHRKRTELCEVLQTAIETAKPLIETHGHKLQVGIPECPVWVDGDETRLAQLFGNLLSNAAKYTGDGGQIALNAFAEGKEIIISVRDNGIGIAPEKLPYIFDMFMQVDSSMERAQGGLGIGLMLVKSIAELHGGKVAVLSQGKNKGTEFVVRLPILEQSQQTTSTETDKKPFEPSPDSYRILIVDDNKASAETLGWMLESLGHQAQLSYNAKNAIAVAHSYKPDVVLLDIGLPDMDGYKVCQEMRADPALKHTVFIAQTGWGQEQHRQRSKQAGFDAHLIKPVSIDALQEQLARLRNAA